MGLDVKSQQELVRLANQAREWIDGGHIAAAADVLADGVGIAACRSRERFDGLALTVNFILTMLADAAAPANFWQRAHAASRFPSTSSKLIMPALNKTGVSIDIIIAAQVTGGPWGTNQPCTGKPIHAAGPAFILMALGRLTSLSTHSTQLTFVDIGSNMGSFSLIVQQLGSLHVYAFEPIPVTCGMNQLRRILNGLAD